MNESISRIRTLDRDDRPHTFQVEETPFQVKDFKGIEFRIFPENSHRYNAFTFKILFVNDNRILIYLTHNNYFPDVSEKGILKSMIKAIRTNYKKSVVSSTRKENLKVDIGEGRVPEATRYWEKWRVENPKISYIPEEDRFIYEL
jgi:hypothetical protein